LKTAFLGDTPSWEEIFAKARRSGVIERLSGFAGFFIEVGIGVYGTPALY
jgi:hypothetical protein